MGNSRDPSEEAINDFIGVAGLPRAQAIQWLKAYNNDANNAVDAYYANPNAVPEQQNQVTWDEGPFHIDKPENVPQGHNAFSIHPSDTLKPDMFGDGAPSRPPSRVSQRETGLASENNMDLVSEEDQLNKAIAMSRSEDQNLAPQESGVLDLQSKAFGPATRNAYEPEKWALTLAGAQTQEILLNPEPNDRKRQANAPAFIKPSPSGHRLPALVTILHAIPIAREALLNRGCTLPDYGHDKDWWDGSPIKVLRIVNTDSEGRRVHADDILYECQRLMAFLDETDRAYGNIDVLAGLEGLNMYDNDKVSKFLGQWQAATIQYAPDAPLASIFECKGTKRSTANLEDSQTESFWCITAKVESEIVNKGLTLYDLLDQVLWNDNNEDEETYLEEVGDILTMEVTNQTRDGTGLGIDVPAVWYLDRYLPSAVQQAKDMRSRKAEVSAELQSKEAARSWMTKAKKPSDNTDVDATQLLAKVTAYFEQTTSYHQATKEQTNRNEMSQDRDQSLVSSAKMAAELKTLTERVTNKLRAFEKTRESACEKLTEISQLYTKPSDDPKVPPHHKYTLRGVSADPHTIYALEKTQPEDKNDMLSTDAKDWQWWKLEYVSSDPKPVVNQKVTEEEVLKAASTESRSALLIYASERAVSHASKDLPLQLQHFVRMDNLSFSAELESSSLLKPATPTKRKADEGDYSDMEAQVHRSPPYDRSIERDMSMDDFDPNPPGYYESPSPPALPSRRPAPRKAGAPGSYDDTIPTKLRATGPTIDPTSMILDTDEQGQEMQERGVGRRFLHQQKNSKDGYALGDYVPEINMEDDEEDEDQRGGRHVEHVGN